MQTSTLIAFSLVALVAIVTPGPTMLLALANGTRLGFRRSLPGMLGALLSDIVLVAAVAMGLRALHRRAVQWLGRCCGAALLMLSGSLLLYRRSGS
jgi:threonine/homoserine/homoserine lactone efflux protein